jgi:hypothetical protein
MWTELPPHNVWTNPRAPESRLRLRTSAGFGTLSQQGALKRAHTVGHFDILHADTLNVAKGCCLMHA